MNDDLPSKDRESLLLEDIPLAAEAGAFSICDYTSQILLDSLLV
jgi:hypothetical protein